MARDLIRRRGRVVLVQRHVFGRTERERSREHHHDEQERFGTKSSPATTNESSSSSSSKREIVPVVGCALEAREKRHRVAVFMARVTSERVAIAQE